MRAKLPTCVMAEARCGAYQLGQMADARAPGKTDVSLTVDPHAGRLLTQLAMGETPEIALAPYHPTRVRFQAKPTTF